MANLKALNFDSLPSDEKPKKVGDIRALRFDDLPVATEDPGILGAVGIGFGRTMDKTLQGLKQAALTPAALVSDGARSELSRMSEEQRFRDEGYAPLQEQRPIASMVGESAPLLAMPMGGSLKAASAIGALPGLVEYGTAEEKLSKAAIGALGSGAGYGIGKAIGAIASPGMKAVDGETERLAKIAAQQGVPLDAAQVTGNQVLQNAKAALSRIPWTAGGQQAQAQAQQEAFGRGVMGHLGSRASQAGPDALGDAHAGIVQKMSDAAASTSLTLGDDSLAKLAQVEKTFMRRLPTDQKPIIRSYLDDLTDVLGREGAIPGDVYVKTRSDLGKLAAETNNSTVREGAKGLQRVLDDAFDSQAPKAAVKAMHEARDQYHKYLTLESAIKKGRSQGPIPAKQLYAQAQEDIPGFNRGKGGDWAELVRAGRKFLPDPVPNSGTPERLMYQNLLSGATMSGLGGLGGMMATGDPSAGAAAGLMGFGASKAAQQILNSPALTKYLMAQVLEEEQKKLLAQATGRLGLLGATASSQ